MISSIVCSKQVLSCISSGNPAGCGLRLMSMIAYPWIMYIAIFLKWLNKQVLSCISSGNPAGCGLRLMSMYALPWIMHKATFLKWLKIKTKSRSSSNSVC